MAIKRREFLGGIAAVGGATLLGSTGMPAEAAASPKASTPAAVGTYSKPVIDAHAHYYSPEFVAMMIKDGPSNGVTIKGPDEDREVGDRAESDSGR